MLKSTLFKISSLLFFLFATQAFAYDYTIRSNFSNWTASSGFGTCHLYSQSRPCISSNNFAGVDSGNVIFSYTTQTIGATITLESAAQNSSGTYYLSLDAMVGPYNANQSTKHETLAITVYLKNSSGGTVATKTFSQNITNTTMDTYVLNLGSFSGVYSLTVYISGKDGGYWNGNYGAVLEAGSVLLSDYDPTAVQSTPTPVYSSGITAAQSTKRTSKLNDTAAHGMEAHVDIDGNYNSVDIRQDDAAHYLELTIIGNSNTIDIDQNDATGTATHFADVLVDGNSNTLDLLQTGSGNKTAFIGVDGNSNTVDVIQKDSGQHYLQLDLIGDGHDATILQEGSGSHEATVELENGGGAWNFSLNQKGTGNKEYSLPHSMSDGSTTSGTCYVAAGCSLTVIQDD